MKFGHFCKVFLNIQKFPLTSEHSIALNLNSSVQIRAQNLKKKIKNTIDFYFKKNKKIF
jgi:hypothetical protein